MIVKETTDARETGERKEGRIEERIGGIEMKKGLAGTTIVITREVEMMIEGRIAGTTETTGKIEETTDITEKIEGREESLDRTMTGEETMIETSIEEKTEDRIEEPTIEISIDRTEERETALPGNSNRRERKTEKGELLSDGTRLLTSLLEKTVSTSMPR